MPFTIYLGNRAVIDTGHGTVLDGKYCTTVCPPEDAKLADAFADITRPGGVWEAHSAGPPAWVAVDHEDTKAAYALAELLASHYGCEIRTPELEEA